MGRNIRGRLTRLEAAAPPRPAAAFWAVVMGEASMDELPEDQRFDLAGMCERRPPDPTEDPLFGRMVELGLDANETAPPPRRVGDKPPGNGNRQK